MPEQQVPCPALTTGAHIYSFKGLSGLLQPVNGLLNGIGRKIVPPGPINIRTDRLWKIVKFVAVAADGETVGQVRV